MYRNRYLTIIVENEFATRHDPDHSRSFDSTYSLSIISRLSWKECFRIYTLVLMRNQKTTRVSKLILQNERLGSSLA